MPGSRTVELRWNAILNDFRRSGLTQAKFCRRRDISLASFRYQFYKRRSSKPCPSDNLASAGTHNRFLPVTILPDPTPSTASFGEYCANMRARVNVLLDMITVSDPLPGDLETAHQLIRELLETLGQGSEDRRLRERGSEDRRLRFMSR